jgi:hypothetical protein
MQEYLSRPYNANTAHTCSARSKFVHPDRSHDNQRSQSTVLIQTSLHKYRMNTLLGLFADINNRVNAHADCEDDAACAW